MTAIVAAGGEMDGNVFLTLKDGVRGASSDAVAIELEVRVRNGEWQKDSGPRRLLDSR